MARTVKTSAEVLASITPPEPETVVVPEPVVKVVTEAPPEVVVAAPVEPVVEAAPTGPKVAKFLFNTTTNIQFPDRSEYLAIAGFHDIADMELAEKITRYISRPGAKTALFRLS